jgi:hypothetical protein
MFEKYVHIKHANPSSGRRVVTCGQTDRHVTKLKVAFCSSAKASKKDSDP